MSSNPVFEEVYNKNTRTAYDKRKAIDYHHRQTKGLSWMRFTTWRQKKIVGNLLKDCFPNKEGRILDIPCGTGILVDILPNFSNFLIFSDISFDMIEIARNEVRNSSSQMIVNDITNIPFKTHTFQCVLTIGLMHRLPAPIRKRTLKEITSISGRYCIISYTINNRGQRFKKWIVKLLWKKYQSAPVPLSIGEISDELLQNKLSIKKRKSVMPLLSSDVVLLLEKMPNIE